MKRNYLIPLIIGVVSLIIVITMIIILASNSFNELAIDTNIKEAFYNTRGEKYHFVYWFNRIFTEFGYTYAICLLVIIVALVSKLKLPTLTFIIGAGGEYVLNTIIKKICDRERPDEALRWMSETSKSFPSGHSCCSACCYTLVLYFVIRYSNKKWQKVLASILCPLIVLIVMTSRLVLGVHYATDVFTGFFVGVLSASLTIILHELLMSKDFDFLNPILFKKIKEEQ